MAKKKTKKKGPAPKTAEQRKPKIKWTFGRIAFLIFSILMMLVLVLPPLLQAFLY